MIRRKRLRQNRQRGVAIAFFQIAQHLVVRAILLDDVDHVLNLAAERVHGAGSRRARRNFRPAVVLLHALRQC